jgi:uncharacterized alpha-E superfamily protein
MISRVADHCLWFGRYVERADSVARVLFVTRNLALDAELSPQQVWQPVIIVAGEESRFAEHFGEEAAGDGEAVQRYMTWHEENLVSIRRSIHFARENARSIREVVSLEAWETINELHLWIGSDAAEAEYRDSRYGFYRHIRNSTQLCLGVLRSTMLQDTPLDFIQLGVQLERTGQTARILDVHHHALTHLETPHYIVETALWLSLLRACSGFEPFMKRNAGKVTGNAVAAFLILEPRFPRSVRYCLHSAFKRLGDILPPDDKQAPGGRARARLGTLDQWLGQKTSESLAEGEVHSILTHVVDEISVIGDLLGEELFGYARQAPAPVAVAQ